MADDHQNNQHVFVEDIYRNRGLHGAQSTLPREGEIEVTLAEGF
jgi:hypothetical protein